MFLKRLIRIVKRAVHDELYSDPHKAAELYRKKGVKVGENTEIYNTQIDNLRPFLVSIGKNTLITGTRILSHDASTKKLLGYTKIGRVDIGDNVFIGIGCIILPNVRIGNRVIVGAGTIISKDIPDGSIVVGNPMRIIGTTDGYIQKNRARISDETVFDSKYQFTSAEREEILQKLDHSYGYVKCED